MDSNKALRAWLVENGYEDVAGLIERTIAVWKNDGKTTRRNWWDILAGTRAEKPRKIGTTIFPILRAARLRKGWTASKSCLCRNKREAPPPVVPQARWLNRKKS